MKKRKVVTEKRWALWDAKCGVTLYPHKATKEEVRVDAMFNGGALKREVKVVRVTLIYEVPR